MNDDDEDVFTEEEQELEVNSFKPFPQQILLPYFLRKFHVVSAIVKTLYFYLKSTPLFAFILITDQKYYKPFRLDYTCSNNESLITLQTFSTWEVLLNAAKIRNHE